MDEDSADFEVWVGDAFEAATYGPRDKALAEARHYALQYASDGCTVTIKEVIRRDVETVYTIRPKAEPTN